MRFILSYLRFVSKYLIIGLDLLIPVKKNKLSSKQKEIFSKLTSTWSIYEFYGCPFCVRVRRYLRTRDIDLQFLDAKQDTHRDDLIRHGKKRKVPCLRWFDDKQKEHWFYESADIIAFIEDFLEKKVCI